MTVQFKTATDFRKSLEARLKSIADSTGQDLQRLRRKVAFDRLLARIFQGRECHFLLIFREWFLLSIELFRFPQFPLAQSEQTATGSKSWQQIYFLKI